MRAVSQILSRKLFNTYLRNVFIRVWSGAKFFIYGKVVQSLSQNQKDESNDYSNWLNKHESASDLNRNEVADIVKGFIEQPCISIIMPTYNPKPEWLTAAIESVRNQSYPNWELCIADDASTNEAVRPVLEHFAAIDSRIKIVFRNQNGHIAEASNSALDVATGLWVSFLDQDDLIAQNALFWLVEKMNAHRNTQIIYSDEDKLNEFGQRVLPFFKPKWSPHLLLSQAYIGHFLCIKKKIVDDSGRFNSSFNGAQDYSLILNCVALVKHKEIQHVARILYHWRMHPESTSMSGNAKPYAHEAGRKAVDFFLKKKYPNLAVKAVDGNFTFTYRLEFNPPTSQKVSIIIPTKDGLEYLKPCVWSILTKSTWKNFEIIILDNGSEKAETKKYLQHIGSEDPRVKVIGAAMPFNWSRLNNIGAEIASGEILIFLNNDTQVIAPDWMECLSGYASMPEVGVVGALLLFEDNTIQHSGVVVGMRGWADHPFRTLPAKHMTGGPFVSPVLTRNVLAVTGACLAVDKQRFNSLGGFDESFIICGSDVELGIRAHKNGYFNIICAEASLFHYESKTRASFIPEEDFQQSSLKYAPYRLDEVDPFYSSNLSLVKTTPSLQSGER